MRTTFPKLLDLLIFCIYRGSPLITNSLRTIPGRGLSQITFAFFWNFLTTYTPSLHFLCSKLHVFLTTYPPLSAKVICESSPIYYARKSVSNGFLRNSPRHLTNNVLKHSKRSKSPGTTYSNEDLKCIFITSCILNLQSCKISCNIF